MAFVLKDRVRETTSTSGTGAIFPSGVVTGGYRTFNSQLSNGDTTLCLVRNNAGQWQTFLGTWNSATQSLARTTAYDGSSGAGVNVNFSGEQQEVWIDYPAYAYENPTVETLVASGNVFGAQSSNPREVRSVYNVSGSYTGGTIDGIHIHEWLVQNSNFAVGSAGTFVNTYVGSTLTGSTATGNHVAFQAQIDQTGTTANLGQYVLGAVIQATANSNAGGTLGTENSNVMGANIISKIKAGATYFTSAVGLEVDVAALEQPLDKIGLSIVGWTQDAYSGSRSDALLAMVRNPSSTIGFDSGIVFGAPWGWWPIKSTGTLIHANYNTAAGIAAGAPSKEAAWGIDLSGVTFSGGFLKSTGFTVNGAGALTAGGTATLGNTSANYITIAGNSTGNAPTFTAAGSDSTVGFRFTPKGGGQTRFDGPILQQYAHAPTSTLTPFIRANQTITGAITTGNTFINDFNVADNLDASATVGANWMYFGHVYGSSLRGDRATMKVVTDIAARPADSTTGVKYYVGLNGNMTVKVDLSNGGGGYNGNAIGMSYDARVASGGEVSMIEACEMGAGVMAGGSAQLVNVLKLSPLGGVGAGGGILSYNGLAFSSALGDTGLNVGIAFGGREGTGWPIASTGKLIAITDPSGSPAKTVDYGIDFATVPCTFTTAAFASPGFSVDGSGTTTTTGMILALRVVTAAGAVTVTATDDIVVVNKTVGAATTVNLPASPATGRRYVIKDGKGDAAANNITITPAAGNIDGAATLVIAVNYGRITVVYNGTEWSRLA